ncbi:MAG TPA: LacI family DNA-binding transcriptional regulator [Pseudonocardiaceae bacterium]|nr:LacI family DNA-binding transcriptional regulator [Pseudonocardiaceae bacterium]
MATITDVATAAGVAPSTVSYVLSGKRSISAETRRRVEQTIRELDYRPYAPRSSANRPRKLMAVMMPVPAGENLPMPLEFVAAASQQARAHDHDVLLLTNEPGPDGIRRPGVPASPVDSVVVLDVGRFDPRLPMLRTLTQSVVLIGVPDRSSGLTCVDLDFTAAGAVCVRHLADLGHRHVALIGPPPSAWRRGSSFAGRFLSGFTSAVAERDLYAVVRPCEPFQQGARVCLDNAFRRQPRTTALVVLNDAALPSVLAELKRRGQRVPADVSVIAVCPDHLAEAQPTPLTSVTVPTAQLGTTAVDLAMHQLKRATVPEVRLLPATLTERASTAAPR